MSDRTRPVDVNGRVPISQEKHPKLEDILKFLETTRFHGNITVHYMNGQPRKIEYKSIEDLNN